MLQGVAVLALPRPRGNVNLGHPDLLLFIKDGSFVSPMSSSMILDSFTIFINIDPIINV